MLAVSANGSNKIIETYERRVQQDLGGDEYVCVYPDGKLHVEVHSMRGQDFERYMAAINARDAEAKNRDPGNLPHSKEYRASVE